MVGFLCDSCGREVLAEEGSTVDGYYLEALQVQKGQQTSSDNIYACSEMCLEGAIRDALKRESLPEQQKVTATQELWMRGRQFLTNPELPIVDISDNTRRIGTAQDITNYK